MSLNYSFPEIHSTNIEEETEKKIADRIVSRFESLRGKSKIYRFAESKEKIIRYFTYPKTVEFIRLVSDLEKPNRNLLEKYPLHVLHVIYYKVWMELENIHESFIDNACKRFNNGQNDTSAILKSMEKYLMFTPIARDEIVLLRYLQLKIEQLIDVVNPKIAQEGVDGYYGEDIRNSRMSGMQDGLEMIFNNQEVITFLQELDKPENTLDERKFVYGIMKLIRLIHRNSTVKPDSTLQSITQKTLSSPFSIYAHKLTQDKNDQTNIYNIFYPPVQRIELLQTVIHKVYHMYRSGDKEKAAAIIGITIVYLQVMLDGNHTTANAIYDILSNPEGYIDKKTRNQKIRETSLYATNKNLQLDFLKFNFDSLHGSLLEIAKSFGMEDKGSILIDKRFWKRGIEDPTHLDMYSQYNHEKGYELNDLILLLGQQILQKHFNMFFSVHRWLPTMKEAITIEMIRLLIEEYKNQSSFSRWDKPDITEAQTQVFKQETRKEQRLNS